MLDAKLPHYRVEYYSLLRYITDINLMRMIEKAGYDKFGFSNTTKHGTVFNRNCAALFEHEQDAIIFANTLNETYYSVLDEKITVYQHPGHN